MMAWPRRPAKPTRRAQIRQAVVKYARNIKQQKYNVNRNITGANIVKFKEKFFLSALVSGTAVSPAVALSSISQIASYQNLYSTYKITGLKFTFLPYFKTADYNQATENAAGAVTYGGASRLHMVVDRTNAPVPANEGAMITRNNVRTRYLDGLRKPLSLYIKAPMFQVDANPGGVSTEITYKTGWLDINNSADVPHYSSVFMYQNPTGTGTTPCDVLVTIYFKCKNPI